MDFSNKVVVITGASSGIGAAAAILFAKHSAKVVLVGRNEENLKTVATKCQDENGVRPLIVKAELSVDDDVKNIISQTINEFNRIDVLVNNAGFAIAASIKDGIEPYDRVMSTNVRAVYLLTSLAIPHLIRSKGSIVNVSSIGSLKPIKDVNLVSYCMSKAAMDQFTKCVALELGADGVRVNSVNPGVTRTSFHVNFGLNEECADKLLEKRSESMPLRKIAESGDVADMILYLASDRARSITGSIFVIDNGEMLL